MRQTVPGGVIDVPNEPGAAGINAAEIAAAYQFPIATGRGQRIALIELGGGYHAGDLDSAFADLDPKPVVSAIPVESRNSGLPLQGSNSPLDVTTIGTILDALAEPGATFVSMQNRFEPDHKLWSKFLHTFEVTLDVQIAGALANGAAIDVYFATLDAEGLTAAIIAATATRPTVISISWGGSESWWIGDDDPVRSKIHAVDAALMAARDADITICCSSGDWGAVGAIATVDGFSRVNFPASSPHALACGGTQLRFADGGTADEAVWNATVFGSPRASGGGMSGLFAKPPYQHTLPSHSSDHAWLDAGVAAGFDGRWLPDVAGHASRTPGYAITIGGRPFVADGTSAVCPLWAALLARISEVIGRRVGWINERLYQASGAGCGDVTVGDNTLPGATPSFSATPGWDACTGWGSPRGTELGRVLGADPRSRLHRLIFHIAERDRWQSGLAQGHYTASTVGRELADEGFIHLSTDAQVAGVHDRFYRGVDNLVLLHIDEAKLSAPLVYEVVGDAPGLFPHLYGPLNTDAVVHVDDPFPVQADAGVSA